MSLIPAFIRPGLDDLQPFEKTIEKRIAGMKYVSREVSLRPRDVPHDHTNLSAQVVVESIHDIPPHFERNKLVDYIAAQFRKSLEKTPELAKYVNQVESGKIPESQLEQTTMKVVAKLADWCTERLDKSINTQMSDYLSSDLPFSLFDEITLYVRAYTEFMVTISEVRQSAYRLVSMAHRSRGLKGSELQLKDFKKRVAPLVAASDLAWLSYVSLLTYIELKHSSSYEDLFQDKPCSMERLDRSEYERLFLELVRHNELLRQELAKVIPRSKQEKPKVTEEIYHIWHEMNQLRAESWEAKS